jgi:hypothetical protein
MSEASEGARGGTAWKQAFGLAAVLALEWTLFQAQVGVHYAWIHPRWFDQAQYLRDAYGAFEHARSGGFLEGLGAALGRGSAQGALHGAYALPLFAVAGAGRSAALAVNLAAFVLLQAVTFIAVRRVSGSYALGWAAVGLLAAYQVPWSGDAGSASDFRLDWMAACLYGAALGAAILGEGLRSTRGAVVLGALVGLVLLTRYLTAVYFVLIFAGWLAWLLTRREGPGRPARLALAGLIAVGISGWAFWRTRRQIYDYYWMGHFGGPESALRNSHLTLAESLDWLLSESLLRQLGLVACALGAGAAVALKLASARRNGGEAFPGGRGGHAANPWVPVLLFLAAPAAVLFLHPDKAAQPLEIVAAPLAWVIILVWVRLAPRVEGPVLARIAAGVAALGFAYYGYAQLRDPVPAALQAQYRDENALGDYLFFRSEEAGIFHPRVAVTWVLDGIGADPFELMGWERHGRWLRFVATLPTGLLPAPEGVIRERLSESDFVCLVTRAPVEWPSDKQMEALLPEMRRWCDANLRRVAALDEAEFSAVIYERRTLARAPAGHQADFLAILGRGRRGPPNAAALPPSAPFLPRMQPILVSAKATAGFGIAVAYSPFRVQAEGLPKGARIDPSSGEITGAFRPTADGKLLIHATNPLGSCSGELAYKVVDSEFDAEADAPAVCAVGETVDIRARACDALDGLNFIDVTDLTTARVLRRIETPRDMGQAWQTVCPVSFDTVGRHTVLLRTVRYHPGRKDPYSFVDRSVTIEVLPGGGASRGLASASNPN